MKLKITLFIALSNLFILSCDIPELVKPEIPSKYYNIKLNNNIYDYEDSLYKHYGIALPCGPARPYDFKAEYIYGSMQFYNKYSDNSKHHSFANNDLEIDFEMTRFQYDNNKLIPISIFCHIGCIHRYPSDFCYYILWINRYKLRYSDVIDIKDTTKYYPQVWEIGKTTDTIYTNINKRVIYKLFPRFKGVCVDGKINEIKIKHNYEVNDQRFYKDIEFQGFNRLYDYENIKKHIDSIEDH